MTGYEKIAVLLTELGAETSEKILSILKLSPVEMNKISKNIMALGSYNPRNLFHVQRETAVLEEARQFGELRGIYRINYPYVVSDGIDLDSAHPVDKKKYQSLPQ